MLSCHHGPRGRAAARRAATRLAVVLAVLWPVLGSGPAPAAAGGDRLLPGETLLAGQSISAGRDILTMQGDGNLVLYAPGRIPVWASNTAGNGGAQLVMQADGNLVVAAPGGRPLWAAGTGGHSRSVLILQADGDAILDAPGNVTLWSTNTSKQTYAVIQLAAHGWGPDQFGCLNSIWIRESGWNELAGNPARAYGIPQAYPGSKMAAKGSDWLTNPQTQIRWGEDYIQSRYGTPCQAWAFWQARRYYGPLLAVVPF
jgi:hypothetical protein